MPNITEEIFCSVLQNSFKEQVLFYFDTFSKEPKPRVLELVIQVITYILIRRTNMKNCQLIEHLPMVTLYS